MKYNAKVLLVAVVLLAFALPTIATAQKSKQKEAKQKRQEGIKHQVLKRKKRQAQTKKRRQQGIKTQARKRKKRLARNILQKLQQAIQRVNSIGRKRRRRRNSLIDRTSSGIVAPGSGIEEATAYRTKVFRIVVPILKKFYAAEKISHQRWYTAFLKRNQTAIKASGLKLPSYANARKQAYKVDIKSAIRVRKGKGKILWYKVHSPKNPRIRWKSKAPVFPTYTLVN